MTHAYVTKQYPLPSAGQDASYGDCPEVNRENYRNFSLLDCVTQCSQSAAHLYEPVSYTHLTLPTNREV